MAKDCCASERNENKRPHWHKKGARDVETGAVTTNGTLEIVVIGVDKKDDE